MAAGLFFFLSMFGYWARITHQAYAAAVLKLGLWGLGITLGVYIYFQFEKMGKEK